MNAQAGPDLHFEPVVQRRTLNFLPIFSIRPALNGAPRRTRNCFANGRWTSSAAHPDRTDKTALAGRRLLAMIFENLAAARVSHLKSASPAWASTAVHLDHADTHLGDRESVPDVGRCLSRWVQGIVARVFSQQALEVLAAYASVPVINALSDVYHPCQTLCDFFTLEEKFGSGGVAVKLSVAYVVATPATMFAILLMVAGARVGAHAAHCLHAGGL